MTSPARLLALSVLVAVGAAFLLLRGEEDPGLRPRTAASPALVDRAPDPRNQRAVEGSSVAPNAQPSVPVTAAATVSKEANPERRAVSGAEAEPPANQVTLAGRVLDEVSGEPVDDVQVSLAGQELVVTSDAEGRFELVHQGGEMRDLCAVHPRYVRACLPTVDPGAEVVLALRPASGVRGTVRPSEPGSVVHLWHVGASGRRFWDELDLPVDDEGRFEALGLTPGEYGIGATVPGRYVPFETGLKLHSGEVLQVDLDSAPGSQLIGRVYRRRSSDAMTGVEIELRPDLKGIPRAIQKARVVAAESAADGSYAFSGLAPGTYRYHVGGADHGEIRGKLTLAATSAVVTRDFELPGAARLVLVIQDEGGRPLKGVRVEGDFHAPSSEESPAFSDADGRLVFSVPAEKSLTFSLTGPGSDGFARHEVEVKRLRAGEERERRVIVPTSVVFGGRIVRESGEAVVGARVTLRSSGGQSRSLTQRTESEEDGRFRFDSLFPGRYRLSVRATGYLDFSSHETVEVDQGEEEEYVLSQTHVVHGIALDDQGRALPNLPVRLDLDSELHDVRPQGADKRLTVGTDSEGRFVFDAVYAGTWWADGGSYEWELLEAQPARLFVPEERSVELIFAPRDRSDRFALTGVVALSDGGLPDGLRIDGLRGGVLEVNGGEFRASGLTPTRHRLWIRANGYAVAPVGPIDPIPGGTRDLGRIELEPATRLTVKLRDAEGKPVPKARVRLLPLPTEKGGAGVDARTLKLTDHGKGVYRTVNATRFRWRLQARHPELGKVERQVLVKPEAKQSVRLDYR